MSTDNDLRATLQSACVAGPDALRGLLRDKGVLLALRFSGADNNPSIVEQVLDAVVYHGASLAVLDALEEHVPRLELSRENNGLTELIRLEAKKQSGCNLVLQPDPARMVSVVVAVRSLVRHMRPDQMRDLYQVERGFHKKRDTLPNLALEYNAYYVFGALGGKLVDLADSVLFIPQDRGVCTLIAPIAQDVLLRLTRSSSYEDLWRMEERLQGVHNRFYDLPLYDSMTHGFLSLSNIQINLHAITNALRCRMLLRVVNKGRTKNGQRLPVLPDGVVTLIQSWF